MASLQQHKHTKTLLHPGEHGMQEYLVFTLGQEEYGVDLQIVQELRKYETVTAVANTPAHIKGVINLRGMIVPILDLRIRLGMQQHTYDQFTVVIILNLGEHYAGVVVEGVSDVITPGANQIQAAPQFSHKNETHHFMNIATIDNRMILLTNIDHLINTDELRQVEKIAI